MKHILFVCTGNICRSPMAEGLFRREAAGRDDFTVSSAGVSAMPGQTPSPEAVQVLREVGVDISHQRSQFLDEDMVENASFVFVMTRGHLRTVQKLFPQAAEKTFLIREFESDESSRARDIADPIGLGLATYSICRDEIATAIGGVLAFLDNSDENPSMIAQPTPVHPMRIALGTDHGGTHLKKLIAEHLSANGYQVEDKGAFGAESVDYPDFAHAVCKSVISGGADRGILVCKTGIGMSIAANRFPQIRAALVSDPDGAKMSRLHNNANVLCLAGGRMNETEARKVVDTWLSTPFEGGRHTRRLEKAGLLTNGETAVRHALAATDPDIAAAVAAEAARQNENIELIASENFTSRAVMEAQGSCLTNKYAEGYPGKRWYGGCEHVDVVEQLAIDRLKKLFAAEHANVQPHSGSQANMAVYFSVLQPGDRILTMDLSHGGHLTHGHKANFSGKLYEVCHYGVSPGDERIDYNRLAEQAGEFQPKMITAGASAYPRLIDFARMREIADSVGAYLFVDMAHIAGLVAGGAHPSPVPHAHFVTSTTHKSLRGPRGGIILCKEEFAKKIDAHAFPGVQGGPLMHVIAAKAVSFHEALQPTFADYARQIVSNAKALAVRLGMNGYRLVSGGTDNHVLLVDLRPHGMNGKEAQEALDLAGITVNKNSIPFDTESIMKTGGIRIGTPASTTRGMREEEMMEVADWIHRALEVREDPGALAAIKQEVIALTSRFPLPG